MTGGTAPRPASMATPTWAAGGKDLVMTALGTGRVWATMAHGILNEIYWPAVDQPQIKDFGFLVAGSGMWRELKRVNNYTLSTPNPVVALPTITHTGSTYQVQLRVVLDPDRDALLITYNVTGAGVRLYPLLAPHLGVYQQQAPSDGTDNTAWVDPADNALFASAPGNRCVCLVAQTGFARGGAGYVGDTDGWTDFSRHQQMTLTFSQAGPGVVALMGELIQQQGTLALAFAETPQQARTVAQQSLTSGFAAAETKFTSGWQNWAAGLNLPGTAQGLSQPVSDAIRHSAMVLKTHEDHTVAGAFVAGLATPWGEDTNDPGGYHMVWCRDATESGLGLAAAGHTDDALALLHYLTSRQQPDGHWPRCFFVQGSFDPFAAVQLDEVAFPVVLAARLDEFGVALPPGTDAMIQNAARYLARNGPISGVERWEENFGGSPFTIGLEVAALVVAASRLSGQDQQLALALADNWNERIEAFSFVAGGELDQFFGTAGHYVRIGPPAEQIRLGNQPGPTQPIDAEALVGMEFLYLPRIGLRDPNDVKITDTLKVVEAMIAVDTPSGRGFHRYNLDGYGEWLDGSGWPVRHFGIGRPWPLLSGERGHYEVLLGHSPAAQLTAMLAMAGRGGLLPEQIWDVDPLPWRFLEPGKPAGSAMPLAWAHSELIKLAVAASNGRPVEMLNAVTNRYHAQIPRSDPWFWRDAAPVTDLPLGRGLVVADTQAFTLHFGFDEWQNVTELPSQPLGLGLFGVALASATLTPHASLQFVRRYSDGHWEPSMRNDVNLNAARAPALQLSVAARARIDAGART